MQDVAPLLMLVLSTEKKHGEEPFFFSCGGFLHHLMIDLLALMIFESMDANAHLFCCRFRNRVDGGWVDALFLLFLAELL